MSDDTHSPTDADDEREPHEDRDEHGDGAPLPFAPDDDDDTPLGDTDQHSDA